MNSVSELYSNSPHSNPFYPLRFAAKPEAGAGAQKKKAGLPVIRQPGCPFIVARDPRLSAHRLLGVRLLLIKVTILTLSQLYDQLPRSLEFLPPTISALLFSFRFTPRTRTAYPAPPQGLASQGSEAKLELCLPGN